MKLPLHCSMCFLAFVFIIFSNVGIAETTTPKTLTKSESWAWANKQIAIARGLSIEEVENIRIFQEKFTDYSSDLRLRYPEKISGSWVDPMPNKKGHIRFVGTVPDEVLSEISEWGLLGPENVNTHEMGLFTEQGHSERTNFLSEALLESGLKGFSVAYNTEINKTKIDIYIPEGNSLVTESDVLKAWSDKVKKKQQQGNRVFLSVLKGLTNNQIQLMNHKHSGPIMRFEENEK